MNDYYERTLRLKPLLEQDADLLGRIKSAFEAVYDKAGSSFGPVYVNSPLLFLGSGQTHAVIGLGKSLVDPMTEQEIPLAVSFNRRFAYELDNLDDLQERIGAFNSKFIDGVSVPYFLSVVSANASVKGRAPHRLAGILMEDVSNQRKNQLEEYPEDPYCVRIFPDGTRERLYLDPPWGSHHRGGELWLEERARIDLK